MGNQIAKWRIMSQTQPLIDCCPYLNLRFFLGPNDRTSSCSYFMLFNSLCSFPPGFATSMGNVLTPKYPSVESSYLIGPPAMLNCCWVVILCFLSFPFLMRDIATHLFWLNSRPNIAASLSAIVRSLRMPSAAPA